MECEQKNRGIFAAGNKTELTECLQIAIMGECQDNLKLKRVFSLFTRHFIFDYVEGETLDDTGLSEDDLRDQNDDVLNVSNDSFTATCRRDC